MMTENKKYTRKCIATNNITPINKLVRFSFDKRTNLVELDLDHTKLKRGAYFIPTQENWNYIKKTRALNRVFRTNVSPETYTEIEEQLKEVLYGKEK
ncbi:YlxR family protein [Mycoplasma sp. Z473B]|uniref:YlxR family protein n=1 Tax=Mycoplasma sp. Z473B TaxID=3401667 RepID=UPI003AAA3DD9